MSNYRDLAHLTTSDFDLNADPSITGAKIAQWIRTKAYGVDVRESLAQWVEVNLAVQKYINEDETAFKVNMQNRQEDVEGRQTQVEGNMSDVLNQFKNVIANATKDSEVILARGSSRFGNYPVLDDRMENIESLLASYVPSGSKVTINHNQNRQPKVVVHYYEYAIGTEPDGFGTGPHGLGETSAQTISCEVDYTDDNTVIVHLPFAYTLTGTVTYKGGYWYLIDGYKTLRFDLGDDIDDAKSTGGVLGNIQGPAGITPTIDDNGHWKIGSVITPYSAGVKDFDDSATLLDISTDKAHYSPSEKVTFHATSVSGHGHLVVNYYNLNKLIATQDVYYGTSELSWSWFLPSTDNAGYSVVIKNYVGENNEENYKFAINVSSDPYNFPIMGFLSKYDNDSPVERKQNLDYLKRLHINLVQFYDWFDLHSLPLPVATNGDSTQVSNTWTDIGNRLTRIKAIEGYCNLANDYGMKSLAYMAMNGSDTNQLVHGLSADMFLYDDSSKNLDHVYKTLDKSKGWGKYNLYNTNWINGPWQDYIVNQMEIVRNNMPFDGWHIDMFGDPGDKYQSDGTQISSATLAGGIHYFLDKAKNLGWDTGINSVSEYGLTDIRQSTVPKYLYTEVWDNRKTYDDLSNLVKFITESRDSNNKKKGAIIAAYMDYNFAKANQGKNFNDDGVILTDLVIMASGGMHLEVGEHLLDSEYFPNNNLNMSDNLKNTYLPALYDFFTAFKEIIGLGYQVDGLATIDGGSVDSLVAGKVCGISRGNDKGYLGLSVINVQTNGDQWCDTDANRTITKSVGNVRVTLNKGVTDHDWYYFDLANLEPQKLNVGADGVVNISSLRYYGFILGVPKN